MKYENWGFLPHLTNGEMFAVTLIAISITWLLLGIDSSKEKDKHDI